MRFVWIAGALLCLAQPTLAQSEAEEIEELREQLERMQERLDALEEQQGPAPEPTEPPADAGEGEAFSLQRWALGNSERFKFSGSIRFRGEYKDNVTDFAKDRSDEQEFVLSRIRLRFDLQVLENLDVVVELQDSRQFGDEDSPVSTARELEATDLSLGYVEARKLLLDGLTLRVGRQKLLFGDQRLVGELDYSNFSNRFDAFSLLFATEDPEGARPPLFQSHAFAAIVDETNTDSDDLLFAGLHTTITPVDAFAVDLYYLLLNDADEDGRTGENGRPGNLHLHTVGTRMVFELGDFQAVGEFAYQFGESADDDIGAFAGATTLSYRNYDLPWQPMFALTYVYGSGDDDPNDGDHGTFSNLFPTNHSKYGAMDLFSWQNVENLQATVKVWPAKGLLVAVDYHFFRLPEIEDFWYNAGRNPIRAASSPRNTGQSASQTVGQEIDLTVKYDLNDNVTFFAQYAHFFSGPYVGDTGTESDADFVGLTVNVKF